MTDTAEHTIVMTGASRGIGAIAAKEICRRDPRAHLVVLGRNPGTDSSRLTHVEADLSSISATRSAVTRVVDDIGNGLLPPLFAVIGNAGIQYTNATTETVDGLEATFAVNVVANHVLLTKLSSVMTPQTRVVITVSDTHFGDFRHNMGMVPAPRWTAVEALATIGAFDDPASVTAGRTAYSTSKLAAIHLVHAWSRRLPHVVSFNPGFVPGTDLARDAGAFSRFAMRRVLPFMTWTPLATTPIAAGQALAAVTLGETATHNGDYVDRRTVTPSSAASYDADRESELVTYLDALAPLR